MMSHPRSLPTSFDSPQRDNENGPYQRSSLPRSLFLRGDQGNNNNNNNHHPHISKLTVSSRPSPASSNFLNESVSYSQNEFEYEYGGSGETRSSRLFPRMRGEGSERFRPSYLTRRSSSEQMLLFDPNRNPIYDEALTFVSPSLSVIREKKSEICADFVYEHFKCPICLDVLIEATAINCGHRFCLSCIDTWLETKHQCPLCELPITSKLRQFDIDNAINSVAPYLSEEWRTRRQFLLEGDRGKWNSSLALTPVASDWVSQTWDTLTRSGRQIHWMGSHVYNNYGKKFANGVLWIHENVTLEAMVKGMLITSFLALLWYTGDHFLSFLQYIYHAAKSYDTSVPPEEQIDVVRKKLANIEGHQLAKGQQRFREFVGIRDTIYASFIEMFYKGWNWNNSE